MVLPGTSSCELRGLMQEGPATEERAARLQVRATHRKHAIEIFSAPASGPSGERSGRSLQVVVPTGTCALRASADGADHQPAVKKARPGVAVRAGSREALSAPRVVARGRPQPIEAAQGAAASESSRERHRRLIDRGTARLNRTSPAPTVTDV